MGQLPTNHDVGRVVASLHPQKAPQGTLRINHVFLVVILLFDVEIFLVREEDIFLPVLSVPLVETLCSCPSDLLHSKSKALAL